MREFGIRDLKEQQNTKISIFITNTITYLLSLQAGSLIIYQPNLQASSQQNIVENWPRQLKKD